MSNLLLVDHGTRLTLQQIHDQALSFAGGSPALSNVDLEKSLFRLVAAGRVVAVSSGENSSYQLSEIALADLWELQEQTETRFDRTVHKLFRNADQGPLSYSRAFLDCLSRIFSELGSEYVRLLTGQASHENLVTSHTVRAAIGMIKHQYPSLDGTLFESAIFAFFRDRDPDYDNIKWNLAQNYYIAKALGLDANAHLLSQELFGGAVFYLDTNILVHALEPEAQHFDTFKTLSKACDSIGIKLCVCHITLAELRIVLDHQRELVRQVTAQVPAQTVPKVRSMFFQLYRKQIDDGKTIEFDELFSNFLNPSQVLEEWYDVSVVDDAWFVDEEDSPATTALKAQVTKVYELRRRRPKSNRAVTHDALLLGWIERERAQGVRKTWVVTLDRSLPDVTLPSKEPVTISLDALLQWISPIAIHDAAEGELSTIYAEAVRFQLLPQETIFDLRDFVMFAEMEWSCAELPASDVEDCIRYIRAQAPNADPSKPQDLQTIAYEVNKFFADPSREFKGEVSRLEGELASTKREQQFDREEIARKQHKIDELEKEISEQSERDRQRTLKRSATRRAAAVAGGFVLTIFCEGWLASRYASGDNLWQRLLQSWPYFALTVVVWVGIFRGILGRERIHALGWLFEKLK